MLATSENLPKRPSFRGSFRPTQTGELSKKIYLQHIDAEQLGTIVRKLYPDLDFEIKIDSERNLLSLEYQSGADVQEIEQLIRSLDTDRDENDGRDGQ